MDRESVIDGSRISWAVTGSERLSLVSGTETLFLAGPFDTLKLDTLLCCLFYVSFLVYHCAEPWLLLRK